MDARTRERLPVLPVLVRCATQQHADAAALLHAARDARPGDILTDAGQTLARAATRSISAAVWAEDLATGQRRNLTIEEDRAFWAWAAIEVLRATGIRIEELTELSHHSLVQYRLPGTGELIPLLQIAPSKTDAERLLVVSPELADVFSAIITRIREPHGAVPQSPSTTTTNASGWPQPPCYSSAGSAVRTVPSPPPPSAGCSPTPSPAPGSPAAAASHCTTPPTTFAGCSSPTRSSTGSHHTSPK
jgi:hypothetical protein